MSLGQNIAQKALADFFAAAEVQQAHWYSIKEANEGAYCQHVNLPHCLAFMKRYLQLKKKLQVFYIKGKLFHHHCYMHGRSSLENTSQTMSSQPFLLLGSKG
jgi:hypothetical protein